MATRGVSAENEIAEQALRELEEKVYLDSLRFKDYESDKRDDTCSDTVSDPEWDPVPGSKKKSYRFDNSDDEFETEQKDKVHSPADGSKGSAINLA